MSRIRRLGVGGKKRDYALVRYSAGKAECRDGQVGGPSGLAPGHTDLVVELIRLGRLGRLLRLDEPGEVVRDVLASGWRASNLRH
jgi:hypothetical protein